MSTGTLQQVKIELSSPESEGGGEPATRGRNRRGGHRVLLWMVASGLIVAGLMVNRSDDEARPSDPVTADRITPGIWISKTELAALPVGGPAWLRLVEAADVFDAEMHDYGSQDSTDGTHALAAALVYARTADPAMQDEVVSAIRAVVSEPYDTTSNPSALGWARNMTAWVVASELVELERLDPPLDVQWRSFLVGMLDHPYSGDGGETLRDLAERRANNIGAVARTALTTIAVYTGDDALLAEMSELYRAWVEGSDAGHFDWAVDRDRSWQCRPSEPNSFRGINASECRRDGNDLSGVLADEFRRSAAYDPDDFPGENATKYPWEALGGAFAQAAILERAGYEGALEWGSRAPLRAMARLYEFSVTAPEDGWTFGRESGGGADDRWIIYLANDLYEADFPEPAATGHGRPLSWTDWTHSGLSGREAAGAGGD